MHQNQAREEFLQLIFQDECSLKLGFHYEFFQKLRKVLSAELRWTKYAMKNRSVMGGGDGEHISETLMAHMLHKFMIASEMMALESGFGGAKNLEIRRRQLYLSFLMYGLAMATHGEHPLMDKRARHLEQEDAAFDTLLQNYSEMAQSRLKMAYNLTQERDRAILEGKSIGDISVTGRFLWAVVIVTFLDKSLYEVRHGYLAFANTLHNVWGDVAPLMREFYSFRVKVEPVLAQIKEYMERHPRWHE